MPDTEIQLVIQKLDRMDDTLKEHGETLKQLSKVMTSVALQDQQIKTLQNRVDAMWNKVDIVRDHQQHCPRAQVSRLWWALGVLATLWGATLTNFIGYQK